MSRFTTHFERMAVDVLKECDVLGASRLLRTSWDKTWHLMERAVTRGQAANAQTVVADFDPTFVVVVVDPDVATAIAGDACAADGAPLTMPVDALLFG